MKKIRDPRDRRRWLKMIAQHKMLARARTAWLGEDGRISVYRSQDAPHSSKWIHDLTAETYKDYMIY